MAALLGILLQALTAVLGDEKLEHHVDGGGLQWTV